MPLSYFVQLPSTWQIMIIILSSWFAFGQSDVQVDSESTCLRKNNHIDRHIFHSRQRICRTRYNSDSIEETRYIRHGNCWEEQESWIATPCKFVPVRFGWMTPLNEKYRNKKQLHKKHRYRITEQNPMGCLINDKCRDRTGCLIVLSCWSRTNNKRPSLSGWGVDRQWATLYWYIHWDKH